MSSKRETIDMTHKINKNYGKNGKGDKKPTTVKAQFTLTHCSGTELASHTAEA